MGASDLQKFLTTSGMMIDGPIPTEDEVFYETRDGWRPQCADLSYEIESVCIDLYQAFIDVLMPQGFCVSTAPLFLSVAGLNSESEMSREDFKEALSKVNEMPNLNRVLYLYDCHKLVSGIQSCSNEVIGLQGEFYRCLNLIDIPKDTMFQNTVICSSSIKVTSLMAVLHSIFIRLNSLLDYMAKLTFEIEHLANDFSIYPKMASSKVLFGKVRLSNPWKVVGTVFDKCSIIKEIELIRNHVAHNGWLDDCPKVYLKIENGSVVERWVFFPDQTDGRFDRYKNRMSFYSKKDKINLRLPQLVQDFQAKQLRTLKEALTRLREKSLEVG